MNDAPRAVLPAMVVGGWLGAGKTTLVNRLLRGAGGLRIAVMVNDFGDVGIDADLVLSRDGAVTSLAGGCVCCAVGSDLIGALMALPDSVPPFDLVLVETSGVALPGAVARSMRLAPGIAIDGVIVVADAETVRGRAADRHVGDTVRQQLADADLLVLNKVDRVDDDTLAALHEWLAGAAPRAARIDAIDGDVPPDAVFGRIDADAPVQSLARAGGGLFAGDRGARRTRAPRGLPAAQRFETASFALDARLDAAALARALADPALGLVRAKAVLRDADGAPCVLQAVGARVSVSPAVAGTPAAATESRGRLLAIGVRGMLDVAGIAARIDAARVDPRPRQPTG